MSFTTSFAAHRAVGLRLTVLAVLLVAVTSATATTFGDGLYPPSSSALLDLFSPVDHVTLTSNTGSGHLTIQGSITAGGGGAISNNVNLTTELPLLSPTLSPLIADYYLNVSFDSLANVTGSAFHIYGQFDGTGGTGLPASDGQLLEGTVSRFRLVSTNQGSSDHWEINAQIGLTGGVLQAYFGNTMYADINFDVPSGTLPSASSLGVTGVSDNYSVPVPLPSASAMVLVGLALMGCCRRFSRTRSGHCEAAN